METGKLGEDGSKKIQRLLHPDGFPATTTREMTELVRKIFQGFWRAYKESAPTFRPRTGVHMAIPLITESEAQQALNLN